MSKRSYETRFTREMKVINEEGIALPKRSCRMNSESDGSDHSKDDKQPSKKQKIMETKKNAEKMKEKKKRKKMRKSRKSEDSNDDTSDVDDSDHFNSIEFISDDEDGQGKRSTKANNSVKKKAEDLLVLHKKGEWIPTADGKVKVGFNLFLV